MEEEIQEKLEEIYNFSIEVKFKEFRQYEIYCKIDNEKGFCITIIFNGKSTFEENITNIKQKINSEIIKLYIRRNK